MVFFAIAVGFAIIFYFIGFDHTSERVEFVGSMLQNIHVFVINFFCFVGGFLYHPTFKIPSFVLGMFVCFTWGWAVKRRYYKENPAWFAFFNFMLLTGIMLCMNRPTIGALWYRIYIVMFYILTAIFYLDNREKLRLPPLLFKVIVPLLAVFSIFSTMLQHDKAKRRVENYKLFAYQWRHFVSDFMQGGDREALVDAFSNVAKQGNGVDAAWGAEVFACAERQNIYALPRITAQELAKPIAIFSGEERRGEERRGEERRGEEKEAYRWHNCNSNIAWLVDFIKEDGDFLLIKGWAYSRTSPMLHTYICLWLLNGGTQIKIPASYERRLDVSIEPTKTECGFFAVIPKNQIPQGTYTLGIEMQKRYIVPIKKSLQSIETDVQVTIENGNGI